MPRRVLVVDNTTTNRIVLRSKLTAAGYAVDLAQDADAAVAAISTRVPDVVLMSSTLMGRPMQILSRLLGARGSPGRVPVVFLDYRGASCAFDSAVDATISMPASDALLLARLRSVLRISDLEQELAQRAESCREMGLHEAGERFDGPARIVYVPSDADDPQEHDASPDDTVIVCRRSDLLAYLDESGPVDVVVVDADSTGKSGSFQILGDLACRAQTRHAALVVRLPDGAQEDAAMALDMGASEVIFGDPGPDCLRACITQQLEFSRTMRRLRNQVADGLRLAVIDPLTSLYNRRYAMTHLEKMMRSDGGPAKPLAIMLIDIDRFKSVNDSYGHQIGDRVLVAVSSTLADSLHQGEWAARYGGEEFVIALPGANAQEAHQRAEELRRRIAALDVPLDDGRHIRVTLSIGLTAHRSGERSMGVTPEVLIKEADAALYRAKAEGRNQVNLCRAAA